MKSGKETTREPELPYSLPLILIVPDKRPQTSPKEVGVRKKEGVREGDEDIDSIYSKYNKPQAKETLAFFPPPPSLSSHFNNTDSSIVFVLMER